MRAGAARAVAMFAAVTALLGWSRVYAQPAPTSGQASQPSEATTKLAAPAPAAHQCWLDEIKKPCPWVKFGGDLRLRENYTKDTPGLDKHAPANEQHFQRYRTRLWTTFMPLPDVDVNVRVAWEFFNYCRPFSATDSRRDTNPDEAIIDNLNVKWKNMLGLPNTLTVGRQDITDLGDGWLIFDGTPLDGSRTIFFDAVRDTICFNDIATSVDLIYINQKANEQKRLYPFNSQHKFTSEQDSQGAIVYLKNKSIKATQIDGYFIYKQDSAVLSNGYDQEVYTFGGRVEHEFDPHWKARTELAEQFGHKFGDPICATGANSRLTYLFRDPLSQQLRTGYEWLSGDNPQTDKDEGFDNLWGRYIQYSEIVASMYSRETRLEQYTNLHRVYWGYSMKPCQPLELLLDYHLLFAEQNFQDRPGFSNGNVFRGQLLTAWLVQKFSPHVAGHLMGEVFFPGDFTTDARNDVAVFVRYELVFSW